MIRTPDRAHCIVYKNPCQCCRKKDLVEVLENAYDLIPRNAINTATMVHTAREVRAGTEQQMPSGRNNMFGIRLAGLKAVASDGREGTV
jgi:hypothetical protein